MFLFALYIICVTLMVVVCFVTTGNPLALLGVLFLFFTHQVVPMVSRGESGGGGGQTSAIGFTADGFTAEDELDDLEDQ